MVKHAAASLGGAPIDLTHLAVGDSNGTSYNPVATATTLQNERYRTTLTYVQIDGSNPNQLIVEAVIDETVGPFYVREVGIFDSSGALFAIGKFPETFKPNLRSGSGKKLYIRMILAFASAPQVNLVQSENLNYDPNFSTNVFAAIALKLAKAANLSDLENAEEARGNLGLEIGVDVQAFAANLAAFSALVGANKKVPYFTNVGQLALANLFSNRNIIINGDFNIWQRGLSFSNVTNGTYTADRWRYSKASTTATHNVSRSDDVPTIAQAGKLFNYSLLVDCQTADLSVAAADYVAIDQPIEGYNFAHLAQKSFTISFWVKATKIGTYCVSFVNSGLNRSYVAEYNINQSDVWEFKTVNIPASPVDGTWNYLNGVGIYALFTLMSGTNRQTTPYVWQNGEFEATVNQVNACDDVANNFRLCGVQIEVGDVVTPFEHRAFQQELSLCQRYYEKSYDVADPPGTISNSGNARAFPITNAAFRQNIFFKVPKRALPTITYYNPVSGTAGQIAFGWGASNTTNVLYEEVGTSKWTAGTNTTQGSYPDAYFHWVASSEL